MAYTAPTVAALRKKGGSMLAKVQAELALIATEFGITEGEKLTVSVHLSFETGEQTTTRVYFPYKVTVNKIRGIVMKALSGTAGTVTCGNSTGASSGGVLTMAASSAINYEPTAATPTTNNVVLADGYYYLTSQKTTVAGKVYVTLEVTRTA